MNGKKAKQLRALAGVNKETQAGTSYFGTNVRSKEVYHPTELDSDGTPKIIAKYRTATYKMKQGARLLYKMLKKNKKWADTNLAHL